MVDRLRADLIEQFKDKPNIEALLQSFEVQLESVYQFFDDLRDLRAVGIAMGNQLDGIGNIVDLTRADAGSLSSIANPGQILDDETYRTFLYYKIWKNTNTCTYPDIIKSFQMFWDLPLYYSESPEEPATMILSSDILKPEDNSYKLLTAPIIKAAGVKLIVRTITVADVSELTIIPNMHYSTISKVELPEILPVHEFERELYVGGLQTVIEETTLYEIIPEHEFEKDLYLGGLLTGLLSSGVVEILPVHEFEETVTTGLISSSITETNIEELIPIHQFEESVAIGTHSTEIEITDLLEITTEHSFTEEKTITNLTTAVMLTDMPEVIPVPDLEERLTKEVITADVVDTLLPDLKPSHSFSRSVGAETVAYTVVKSKIPNCEQIVFDFTADNTMQSTACEVVSTTLEEMKEDKE